MAWDDRFQPPTSVDEARDAEYERAFETKAATWDALRDLLARIVRESAADAFESGEPLTAAYVVELATGDHGSHTLAWTEYDCCVPLVDIDDVCESCSEYVAELAQEVLSNVWN